ncbi:MAG TPA: ATP-binding protein [Dokdonella sp.]|uniref:ATP-binding protein n=1 Tax=Dokdonella sp. TaxID=2291710 RepID=UPI0025BC668B|nr:ATP-binding protein [Dokdonella sp.]MBX3690786.1 HAMP domain-containing protein [Dokdonella sp.]MCW5566631.1 HAMP domain-containing protein [Dokdonella sp.]HNR91700.1 ATP-binding protein [Dokdonella sp.]
MRSLFWRIFAAIWLGNVAVIVAFAWIMAVSFETERVPGLELTRMQAVMDEQLRRLDRSARRAGAERVDQSLRIAANMGPVEFYAVGADDRDRLGRPLSTEVLAAVATTRAGTPVETERMRSVASQLRDDDAPIVFVAAAEGSLILRAITRGPVGGWMQIVLALVVSAIVGALLAWTVAAPLARIRASARRFAEGDLDARVGELRFGGSTEMTALAGEFDRMAERIKALVENNRRLVRDVSHELRSPLARLRVALELARGQGAAAVEASFERIERESDRLESMLAQAIELSRLETGIEPRREHIALDELVEDVIANADYEGGPRGRKVAFVTREPIALDGVRDALMSAVENIVRNALAYTADNSSVEVTLQGEGGDAVLRIRDHGPGVAEADLPRIFEPFYRTDAARARSSGGTGLGLAIAFRAIANHRGTVVARNADGGGLEVVIRLPRDEAVSL